MTTEINFVQYFPLFIFAEKIMIFYFSATGNSQYIAQRLAEVTGETLVSITECLKNHKYTWELLPGERVGFVTPVYFFGLPSIVSEFIRNLDLCVRGQHFVYHVVTFGTITGQSHYMMEKALRKKGLNLDGRYIVKMVDTYTLMFDLSDEEKCEKVTKDAEVCIDRVIEKVVNRVRGDLIIGRFLTGSLFPILIVIERNRLLLSWY